MWVRLVCYLQPSLHMSTPHCTKNESIVRGCVKNAHLRSERPSLQGRRRKVGERRQGCVGYFSHQRKLLLTQPLILTCVQRCNIVHTPTQGRGQAQGAAPTRQGVFGIGTTERNSVWEREESTSSRGSHRVEPLSWCVWAWACPRPWMGTILGFPTFLQINICFNHNNCANWCIFPSIWKFVN